MKILLANFRGAIGLRALAKSICTILIGMLCMPITSAFAQKVVSLNVLYSGAYVNKDTIEDIVARFGDAHPGINIRLEAVKGYAEMTQLMLRTAITGSMPDVGFQGLSFVRLFADRSLAVPLDDFIKSDSGWSADAYAPTVLSLAKEYGKIYGIPFGLAVPTIYVNGDLVRQAGGDPDHLPRTWPEILALAKSIKAESGGIYFDYTPTGNWTFMALIAAQGGRMMTADDKQIAFDGPEGRKALALLKSVGEAGMKDMTRDQAKQSFAGGSLGIFISSSSDITLYRQQSGGRFDLRVIPFPVETGGTIPAGGNAIMIHTSDPVKQRAAWEFIKFATSPESQTIMAKKTSYVPGNRLAIESPDLLGTYYMENPNLIVAVSQLPILSKWFSFPGENSLKITNIVADQLRDVLMQRRSPDDAMSRMVHDVGVLLP